MKDFPRFLFYYSVVLARITLPRIQSLIINLYLTNNCLIIFDWKRNLSIFFFCRLDGYAGVGLYWQVLQWVCTCGRQQWLFCIISYLIVINRVSSCSSFRQESVIQVNDDSEYTSAVPIEWFSNPVHRLRWWKNFIFFLLIFQ